MSDFYTEDIGEFGAREREMAGELLLADFPDGFSQDGVKVAFNKGSGNVFLVNDDFQVAMMNGGEMQIFYSTPYEGLEGFIDDLLSENNPDDLNQEDIDFILEAAKAEGAELPRNWAEVSNE